MEEQLDSGVYIVTTPTPIHIEKPQDPTNRVQCIGCQKYSKEFRCIMTWRTTDGWAQHRPTCKHPPYYLCKDCRENSMCCPICGCQEEYC